jgi:hypothetical protein
MASVALLVRLRLEICIMWKRIVLSAAIGHLVLGVACLHADDPVALRITNMGVTPAHMPPVTVWVKNVSDSAYEGSVRLELPEGWRASVPAHDVSLEPGEVAGVRFTLHDAKNREENRYALTAVALGAGQEVRHSQEIVCASAPYFKPDIDGEIDDWKDAIPCSFVAQGKKTTVHTFWNRRQFSMLVAVEEDNLISQREDGPFDAVQIAISPQDTTTSTSTHDEATRHEFLLMPDGAGQGGRCFRLAEPGTKLAETQAKRDMSGLEIEAPKLVVWREGNTTYYEWGISFRSLSGIRPSEGREFFLSLLVHDPDGTGLRDWGEAAGLWPCQRNRLAWSVWPGAKWRDEPPLDNKVEWGMCSSKY